MKLTRPTKIQVLEKHIEDFNRITDFIDVLKVYVNQLIIEEQDRLESLEQGCCDGANDSENLMKTRTRYNRIKTSETLLKSMVIPAEERGKSNCFVSFVGLTEKLNDLLDHMDSDPEFLFPADMFPENPNSYSGGGVESHQIEDLIEDLNEDRISNELILSFLKALS